MEKEESSNSETVVNSAQEMATDAEEIPDPLAAPPALRFVCKEGPSTGGTAALRFEGEEEAKSRGVALSLSSSSSSSSSSVFEPMMSGALETVREESSAIDGLGADEGKTPEKGSRQSKGFGKRSLNNRKDERNGTLSIVERRRLPNATMRSAGKYRTSRRLSLSLLTEQDAVRPCPSPRFEKVHENAKSRESLASTLETLLAILSNAKQINDANGNCIIDASVSLTNLRHNRKSLSHKEIKSSCEGSKRARSAASEVLKRLSEENAVKTDTHDVDENQVQVLKLKARIREQEASIEEFKARILESDRYITEMRENQRATLIGYAAAMTTFLAVAIAYVVS